jgi:hypothetical protein
MRKSHNGSLFNTNGRTKSFKYSTLDEIKHIKNYCVPKSANVTPQIRSRNNSSSRKNIEISAETIEESIQLMEK